MTNFFLKKQNLIVSLLSVLYILIDVIYIFTYDSRLISFLAIGALSLSIIILWVLIKKEKKNSYYLLPIIVGFLSSIVIKSLSDNLIYTYLINITVIIAIIISIFIIIVDAEKSEKVSRDRL